MLKFEQKTRTGRTRCRTILRKATVALSERTIEEALHQRVMAIMRRVADDGSVFLTRQSQERRRETW